MEGQEGTFGVGIAEKKKSVSVPCLERRLAFKIPTFGCIVKISKTRSVDNRRSSSTTGIFNVIDGGLRPREVWAVSLDDL